MNILLIKSLGFASRMILMLKQHLIHIKDVLVLISQEASLTEEPRA